MNEAVYNALCTCFALQPSSDAASVLIREAYQEPENAPRPPRNMDVIYYSAAPDPSVAVPPAAYASENPASASHKPTVSNFAAYRLQIVCYGPHALENARKIRAFLYLDGSGFPRSILRKAGIYLIPNPPEPTLLHEPEGSLWRQRADLTIQLRVEETLTHPARRYAITVAPAVRVYPEHNAGSIRNRRYSVIMAF